VVGRRVPRGCLGALLAIVATACFGCASIRRPALGETPPAPESRVYPTVAGGCACAVAPVAARWFQHVLIIVLENQDYQDAINTRYLGRLAEEGANFTNFHSLFHPSYSNYLAMVAGKPIPTTHDRQKDLNECTIGDLMQARGLSWKNYAQGYPAPPGPDSNSHQCFKGNFAGRYARKHVPFISFIPIQQQECANVVTASQFNKDINKGTRPEYAFYTPDLDNDGHDTSLAYATKWLRSFLEPLRQDQAFMTGTLIIVTFDESRNGSPDAGNHIYTVFLGPMVRPQQVQEAYNHYDVLRTIEENFGLCPLGAGDDGARPIMSVWR
jgi:Phosphoesterase family